METKPIKFVKDPEVITSGGWGLDVPSVYQIEIFDRCNLACPFCPTGLSHGEVWKLQDACMDLSLFSTIVDRDLNGSTFVELQQRGEPTLNPNILDMIEYLRAKHPQLKIGFSTHGNFLHNDLRAALNVNYLTISVEAGTKERYEKLRVGGNWNKLWLGIKRLVESSRSCKYPLIDLQLIELPGWEQSKEELVTKVRSMGLDSRVHVRSVKDTLRGWYDNVKVVSNDLCINPWTSVSIHTNGDVVPCCMSFDKSIVYGNLREQSLEEIWQTSSVLKEFREAHRRNQLPPLCSKCYARSPAIFHDRLLYDAERRS